MQKFFTRFYLMITLSLAAVSWTATAGNNVLLVHSYHPEHGWTSSLKRGFDDAFRQHTDTRLFHEYMDAKRYPKSEFKTFFLDYLKNKYHNTPLDVVVVTDDAALQLIREHRDEAFRDLPVIYLGINRVTQAVLDEPRMSGIFENRDLAGTIFDIKRFTKSDELIVVSDSTVTGKANLAKIAAIEGHPDAPKKIHVIEQLADDQIAAVFSHYKKDTPVLMLGQFVSPAHNNALLSWNDGADLLAKWTSNPVYTIAITTLEHGAVGADELDGRQHAMQAAELVKQVLAGVSVDDIAPVTVAESQWVFDWPKLKSHRIAVESLPAKSLLLNQEETFYQRYKAVVWVVGAVFIASVLIIILLIEIIRRGSKTRSILTENELRYKDLAQAGANIFWETGADRCCSYISGDTHPIFGLPPEQIIGKTFYQLCKDVPDIIVPWSEYEKAITWKRPLHNLMVKVRQADNDMKIFVINGKPLFDSKALFLGYRGIVKEITEEHQLSKKLAYQASFDSLTGLDNRATFNDKLKDYVHQHHLPGEQAFVCFLDLDRFKLVNDTVGHLIGDAMLAEVATVIGRCIGDNDVLGRLGGDEFGLILLNKDQAQAQAICERIISQVKGYKFHWNKRYFSVGISIGMVPITENLNEIELLSKADLSCYKAKDSGRGRVYISDLDNGDLYNDELQMGYIANVAQAIEQDQFFLVKQLIQPINSADSEHIHYEMLIRYRDEEGNMVPPGLFIPAAEKHSLITLIDQWVLTTVIRRYSEFFPQQNTIVSINLSGISLSDEAFVKEIVQLVKSAAIDPTMLCFEITETAAISQLSRALDFIHEMKKFGIQFALDDFGSGASSFGYLKNLPVDYLKIDGSLVKNIVTEQTDRAIVASINEIAHMMNMKTIAEFVENDEIRTVLDEIGVDYVQGYGIGRPEPC